MTKTKFSKVIVSLVLCTALLLSNIPLTVGAAAPTDVTGTVTDEGTAYTWENMLGTDSDGNRYAGRVWVDRSVYKNGDTAILNTRNEAGSSFKVSLEDDEAFQVIFSALGSTMTLKSTVSTTGPLDVVLILDNSDSMKNNSRMQSTISAANKLLTELLDNNDVRLGIAAYSENASTVLPFGKYGDGVVLNYNNSGVITAYNSNNQVIDRNYNSNGYQLNTNVQAGLDLGAQMLTSADDTNGRKPVIIILTDGAANTAKDTLFDNDKNGVVRQIYYSNNIDPMIALSTLLSAAYNKASIEDHYGKAPMIYGIGVDLSSTDGSNAIIDPAKNFNSNNNNENIRSAYKTYTYTWAIGNNVSVRSGTGSGWGATNYDFYFGHEYPNGSGVTDNDVVANINYVDTYYPVASAGLEGVFEQIYEELSSGVFNPISSSTTIEGATGVQNTPLIYVDFIGQYMEIKEIQSVTLFGASYGVIKNADGTYTVNTATGTNPTTNERWNTAEDIIISVTEQTDGTQKLEIRINQEILPIILEQVVSETVGKETHSTITEILQDPLRVFYTVGIDSDVLLLNGKIDVSKIQGYGFIDDTKGTVSLYSNQFGVMNPADNTGVVTKGDAHVGFKPSNENRYYYHQANQGIFTAITDSNGKAVTIPENNEYGIVWNNEYNLTWMSYEEYKSAKDGDKVYTYVTYYHPTPSLTDSANAAEEVTYLVYTDWKYLKESVAFYDATSKTYLNDGKAIAKGQVESTIEAYINANPNAEIYAVLGIGSMRTSRFHNMISEKEENLTGTAIYRYVPEYTYEKSIHHNNNDVVVWLGNNGKLTVEIETGIALTKNVTEAIGNADDTYALIVTVPAGVTANPAVLDADGKIVSSTYTNNVLTINVKAGETVYVSGIPGGTECAIGEIINGDYYIASKTNTVKVPLLSEALNGAEQFVPAFVTNAPYKYGNLFITKEISSDHNVPGSVMDTWFDIVVNVGTALAGKTFSVEDSAHTTPYDVTVDNNGELTFEIKARQTVEIINLPVGTNVTVTEKNLDSHFAVSYGTRNHSGENEDNDNKLVITENGSATAVVTNKYTPTPVSVDLDIVGTKNFTAEGNHDGGNFTYKVQKWDGSVWVDINGKTAETPYNANESGTKNFTINNVLTGISFTEVGSYAYQVLEVKGNVANVTYDRTLYTFNVIVTDNGGQLEATVTDLNNTPITDGSYEVTFNNTYHTAPVSVDIVKDIDNKSGDNTVSKAGFEFKAVRTDANFNALTGNDASEASVFSDASGEARFTAIYNTAGKYYYVLTEVDKSAHSFTYSDAEYRITVTVEENNGNLIASLDIQKVNSQNAYEKATVDSSDATKGTVSFVNTYDPDDVTVDLDGAVKKVLTGKTLEADMFTFYVYNDGDRTTPVLIGTNNLNGDVHFVDFDEELTFEEVGKYKFDVVEFIPKGAVYDSVTGKYVLNGMSYDPTIYDLVVEVTNDTATGKLSVSYYFEDAVANYVTFNNSYKAVATEYKFSGIKLLNGRAVRDEEFEFELYEGDKLIETVNNKADGSFSFKAIKYTTAGSYTYTIKEALGNVVGVTYNGVNTPITVTVTVTDTLGVLSAVADVENADIKFQNTYTAKEATVTFNGTKTLVGGTLEDNSFIFNLYKTDNSFDTENANAKLIDTKKNLDGVFKFENTLTATGSYYFVIAEDNITEAKECIVYDRTHHKFAVQVTDIGDGQLRASITNMVTGVTTIADATALAEVAFTNATDDKVATKEVYLEGNATTEIDGKKVNEGDILSYFITYTNYNGEDAVVDIMDTIPEHTSYVEGTASHGGTYAGSHLNWILNVPKGESVTVTFDVKVDEAEAIVANTAIVRDGVNTYYTNEVVNHTVDEELKKDVFVSNDNTASVDGKKVNAGDELIYTISFTNTTGDKADIKITDKIPANTTYVEASADMGGEYNNGEIVWEIKDIPAWATVTVAFKVTVNADLGNATIKNQAFATDGTNNYETDWVTSYTEKTEEPQPEPKPKEPKSQPKPTVPTSPQTGDNTNLNMLMALLFVSGGALTVGVCKAKKKIKN